MSLFVNSEIAPLRRLIIHSPDAGLGKVVPSKAQDWLFEDIVHLKTMRKHEYDHYVRLLLYFLDPKAICHHENARIGFENRHFFNPTRPDYFQSDRVIEFQILLKDILKDEKIRTQLTAAVSAIEECSYQEMLQFQSMSDQELTQTLITGITSTGEMFFPPIPNLIFTRDIGIVIHDHLLLNKPAKLARSRESLLAKYVFFNHPYFDSFRGKIIEIEENEEHFLLPEEEQFARQETLEGGDVMMIAPGHLLIGISERTSLEAARQAMRKLFDKNLLTKVTLIKIPAKRDYMHIDTIFTQIKSNVWDLLGSLARAADKQRKYKIWEDLGQKERVEELVIRQFYRENGKEKSRAFENLEDLMDDISKNDLGCKEETIFVYSGNNEFPYGAREQWTDSCNLLVLRDGVAIGYDRNDKTAEAFQAAGFEVVKATDLIRDLEEGKIETESIKDTIILLPSAELSRARGGSHCMSLPVLRDVIGGR